MKNKGDCKNLSKLFDHHKTNNLTGSLKNVNSLSSLCQDPPWYEVSSKLIVMILKYLDV